MWSSRVPVSSAIARLATAVAVFIAALLLATHARADAETCDGPSQCCPEHVERPAHTQTVSIGVVIMGISEINERNGTWDGDYYLYESWSPMAAFYPETEIVNEVERKSTQFDAMVFRDGVCVRSRRIHSTLRAEFNLRAFPFDHQVLPLQISDDEYFTHEVTYSTHPYNLGIDDGVRGAVLGWQIDTHPTFHRSSRAFRWEPGAPAYDYVDVGLVVRRHVTFHLTKFFLPLFVIVMLAFAAFWIDPEDLGSQLTIGITCLLAAIAFQFAEAGNLPEISYLTFADRVYVVCYVAIGLAVIESIYTNKLSRGGNAEKARKIDRACRFVFPVGVIVAVAISALRAFAQA